MDTILQQKKPLRNGNNVPNLNVKLAYTPLPTIEPDAVQPSIPDSLSLHTAGKLQLKFL